MSPIPPPAGYVTPSDDWTNDASFDFDLSPTSTNFALGSSSSPGSSSSSARSPPTQQHHRKSLSGSPHGHALSPLRQSHTILIKSRAFSDDAADDFDDFDLPDSFPALSSPQLKAQSRNTTASSSISIRNLPTQVLGKGPTGIGTVTKLGRGKAAPSAPTATVLARARAIEKAWENDVDFDSLKGEDEPIQARSKRLTLSPPKKRTMPGPDALDEIDFDAEDNEATLKAGATIKAMLPPRKGLVQDQLEADFVLPLNVKNLTLATQSLAKSHPRLGARLPESPSTSVSDKKSHWSWGDDSPKHKSGSSMTSITDGPSKELQAKDVPQQASDDEDMEDGLVIPTATFFATSRARDLNKILDRKRRGVIPATTTTQHRRQATDDTFRTGDDSIEDGLILDNPRTELSRKRLDRAVKSRTPNSLLAKKGSATKDVRERAWEKQREQGWGRHIPSQPLPMPSSRAQSSLGIAGRSQSSGTTGLKDLASGTIRRADLPSGIPVSHDSTLSRTRLHFMAMLPPPIPETRNTPKAPPLTPAPAGSSSKQLRHQKSQYHMPLQSPSLARKPSLASLQDAMSSGTMVPVPPVSHTLSKTPTPTPTSQGPDAAAGRYHHSTSRLTMPTSSSRAKSRPPLHSVFPKSEFTSSSSASSVGSSSREPTATLPRSKSGKGSWGREQVIVPRTMDLPKKPRLWEGNELDEIEDIPVDSWKGSGSFGRSKSRRGKRCVYCLCTVANALCSARCPGDGLETVL